MLLLYIDNMKKNKKKEFMETFIEEYKRCLEDPSYFATKCLIMSNNKRI